MRPHRVVPGFLALLALAFSCRTAAAAWPRSPNANLFVAGTTSGSDIAPAIAPDGSGGLLLAWFDARSGNQDIYAQRISAKGVALWTAGGVLVCSNASDQTYPVVVADGSGGALVTWHDSRASEFDIYAQHVSAGGAVQWAAGGVSVCNVVGAQYHLAATSDGLGGIIATWLDNRSGDGGDIYAQRLNGAGVPQWTANGLGVCTAAGVQQIPRPISDGAGGLIVTWTDSRTAQGVYAQRISAAGTAQWTANGVYVTPLALDPCIVGDGSGGAIIAWADGRSGSAYNIYAQRLNASGAKQWLATGVALCTFSGLQEKPQITTDGSGGAIVAWTDWRGPDLNYILDIYARRVTAGGVAQWTSDGVPLSLAFAAQDAPQIAADGLGGAIVTWEDVRNGAGASDVYARRVTSTGAPQWVADGTPVSTAVSPQILPAIVSDQRFGVFIAWSDYRSGAHYDLYAQRIDDYGDLGNPEPEIVSAKDLTPDQGGHVRIKWNASFHDSLPTLGIGAYGIWRRVSAASAMLTLSRGGRTEDPSSTTTLAATPGVIRAEPQASAIVYWEGVGTVLARGEPWYTFVAETFADSSAAANPYSVFMIDAHDATLPIIWSSVADSGYSVDNIPPQPPAPFVGTYSAGAAHLDWGPNLENDLGGYRLYRGASAGFVPGVANLVATLTGTHFDDAVASGSYYKLAAVDVHNNASSFSLVGVGTVDVPGTLEPLVLALARPSPNPARGSTTLRFTLPRASAISLDVYDAGGRRVRNLAAGRVAAGEHALAWDLCDERGRGVPSGLYFVRLVADGRTLTQRLARIR